MRIMPSLLTITLLLPPLLGQAEEKPKPNFVCSVQVLVKQELSECLDLSRAVQSDAALKETREMCVGMAAELNGEESQKKNPDTEGRANTLDACNTEDFLTACIYPPKKNGVILTTRTYTIDKAFTDKDDCAKEKGTWVENPAYKDYLHPPKVSAEQLHQQWRTNQAKALEERGKKPMALYGKLAQVKVDDDNEVSVILSVSGFQRLVVVSGISGEQAAKFKPNSVVNFARCTLTGRTQLWDNPVVTCE
ncbi:MAG: hypothetical protein WDO74_04670 [Pseudomonadota bacterium]